MDLPCTVFLTKRGIYFDVRSDLLTGSEQITVSHYCVERAGCGTSDQGNPRFVIVYATNYGPHGQIRGAAVDFAPRHKDFVKKLDGWSRIFAGQTQTQNEIIAQMNERRPDEE